MTGAEAVPAVVTLHLWGVPLSQVPSAFVAMGRDRGPVHRLPGLTFAKLLVTGNGRTFTPRDANARRWGLLSCWSDSASAEQFEQSPVARRWANRSRDGEQLRICMEPLASKGTWAGRQPFGSPAPCPYEGPLAALTRARIKPSLTRAFWAAVPPVSSRLHGFPGLVATLGIGEAPVGLQGTFSLWESAKALNDFAYRSPEHQAVVSATHERGWYAEELFARLAVRSAVGRLGGVEIDIVT